MHTEQYVPRGHPLENVMLNLDHSDSSILPEDLATQSVRLKEEQLRREEEKVRTRDYFYKADLTMNAVARNRAQGSTRDQRKETRAARQGGVAPKPGEPSRCSGLDCRVLSLGSNAAHHCYNLFTSWEAVTCDLSRIPSSLLVRSPSLVGPSFCLLLVLLPNILGVKAICDSSFLAT